MARISDDLHAGGPATGAEQKTVLPSDTGTVKVPANEFIAHADIVRDGQDLVLRADGHEAVIKGYFSAEPHPVIQSPSGAILTPDLVQSFVHHDGPVQYAATATASDASPVGVVREVHGHATVKHTDGGSETIIVGTVIHEGDVVETDVAGAVNITFRDNSSFAVSHNAKLAIDEYVFDPHSDAGASNFSMLRGVFVYTSGLIGHQDPDDVHIHTPAGSIGIRGTIIAGDVDSGQVTVVEGAIVLQSNTGEETVLSTQYQTAQFNVQTGTITSDGTLTASDLGAHYSSLNDVAPSFFSGLGSGAHDSTVPHDSTTPASPPADTDHGTQAAPDTSFNTADAIGNDGGAFGTNNVFSSTGATTNSPAASGVSDTTTAFTAPLTAADTSSGSGDLSSVTAPPVVGEIFAGTPATGATSSPAAPVAPLDLATLTSANGFWILDDINEGFGSSTAVASNLSGGLDGLMLVKNANDSAAGGLFFEVAGSTTNSNNLPVTSLTSHNTDLLTTGGDHNIVITAIGAFGPSSAPDFIIGSPFADSIDPTNGSGTGNISIVDSSGALIETITGLGFTGLNVGTALFGNAVAGIGDLNNDGYTDVLVGSPGIAGSDAGAAYVLYGSGSASPSSPLNLDTLNASTGFSILGATGTANLGTDVSSAGDFNNDGQTDFMVSTPGTGEVNVYVQGSSILNPITIDGVGNTVHLSDLGDATGDGITDIGVTTNGQFFMFNGGAHAAGDSLTLATANFTVAPTTGTVVAAGSVGDFNGDGKADIGVVITNGTSADIYVVYGGTLPTTANTAWLNDPTHAFHMVYTAPSAIALTGMTISGAGDLNGDGYGDLVIGLPNLDTNPTVDSGTPGAGSTPDGNTTNDEDGASIVVYGEAGGTASYATATATTNGQSIVGTSGNDTLADGSRTDVSFSGGAGNDTIAVHNGLFGNVNGGSGTDTISFLGSGTLDFSGLGSERVTRIEQIDMAGSGQGLNLTMQNIFNLMDSSDNSTLVITSSGSGNSLTIHNAAGTGSPNNVTTLNATLGSSSFNTDTGNAALTDFHFGSHTLAIETSLVTGSNVHVV